MNYYMVKPEYDNANIVGGRLCGPKKLLLTLIGNELFTTKEFMKLEENFSYAVVFTKTGKYHTKKLTEMFKPVSLNRNKTYYMFGARFYMGKEGGETADEIFIRNVPIEHLLPL